MNEAYNLFDKITEVLENWSTKSSGKYQTKDGLKICWGTMSNMSSGGNFTVPFTYSSGKAIVFPYYMQRSDMQTIFTAAVSGDTVTINALDITTQAPSTRDNLSINYLVIGF